MGFFRSIANFFGEVTSEFHRVSWPTRKLTLYSTGVVCLTTLIVSIYLGTIDLGLSQLIKLIIN